MRPVTRGTLLYRRSRTNRAAERDTRTAFRRDSSPSPPSYEFLTAFIPYVFFFEFVIRDFFLSFRLNLSTRHCIFYAC